jgi:hypothetical protein
LGENCARRRNNYSILQQQISIIILYLLPMHAGVISWNGVSRGLIFFQHNEFFHNTPHTVSSSPFYDFTAFGNNIAPDLQALSFYLPLRSAPGNNAMAMVVGPQGKGKG